MRCDVGTKLNIGRSCSRLATIAISLHFRASDYTELHATHKFVLCATCHYSRRVSWNTTAYDIKSRSLATHVEPLELLL